ncbi:hypothetical protein ACFLW0_01790 [Chloroflexota bacterium]
MINLNNETDFEIIASGVKPDAKKRIVLSKIKIAAGTTYHIYRNTIGQIVLDPQISIPASELWLFKNEDALALVDKGMLSKGQPINRGSFAKYAEDEA